MQPIKYRWQAVEEMILIGDVKEQIHKLQPKSIQTVVTSPPYWGLRDYKTDGQLGQEKKADMYIQNLSDVFDAIGTYLTDDGTLWVNLGDSYKNGNLVGIPWLFAFQMKRLGWILRQDIIWAKPNPTPESVKNRCTKSHEYIFMFAKSKNYFYDSKAIAEPSTWFGIDRRSGRGRYVYDTKFKGEKGNGQQAFVTVNPTKNKRDVWSVATKPYKGAHFAVMPESLVQPCILAATKPGDTVLDPFMGSGTVGVVSKKLKREFIGIEINADYVTMAEKRIAEVTI